MSGIIREATAATGQRGSIRIGDGGQAGVVIRIEQFFPLYQCLKDSSSEDRRGSSSGRTKTELVLIGESGKTHAASKKKCGMQQAYKKNISQERRKKGKFESMTGSGHRKTGVGREGERYICIGGRGGRDVGWKAGRP